MKHGLVLILFLVTACARISETAPKEGKAQFTFTDVSGKFSLTRETKIVNKRLVTRQQLIDPKSRKVVEKSIAVSQIGTIKDGKKRTLTVRPQASEFTVWLEGKKHASRLNLDPKKKAMTVREEGKAPSDHGFPKAKYFCFFSQIPECLYHAHFLQRAHKSPEREFQFYVVWDSYPFLQEQLTGIGKKLFTSALVKFEAEVKKNLQFVVELEGQVIFYHFSKSYDLVRMAWVAQGISIVPPGEEIPDEE